MGNPTGAAYIFQKENDQWVEKAKLIASDAKNQDWFGISVSTSGELAIVGAPGTDGGGSAYIFELYDEQWVQKHKLSATDAQEQDNFGIAVSISGDTAVVGAYGEDGGAGDPTSNAGAAYIY